jgi:hypothetical protein
VTEQEPVVPGIDVTRPSVARVYDFWLGGKDNFPVDRETGGRMAEVNPSLPRLVRDNRQFLCAAAARAAGVGQFLDLGAGLPAHPAVHKAVRRVNPGARVCYVDNDPLAGLEIVPPGVCEAGRWVAGTGGVPAQRPVYPLAAAAVKTGD